MIFSKQKFCIIDSYFAISSVLVTMYCKQGNIGARFMLGGIDDLIKYANFSLCQKECSYPGLIPEVVNPAVLFSLNFFYFPKSSYISSLQ